MAAITKQLSEFPPEKRIEKDRPFGAYGFVKGEWDLEQFGLQKGAYSWSEDFQFPGFLKVTFSVASESGHYMYTGTLPQVRDWEESGRSTFYVPLNRDGQPSGFDIIDPNRRLEPEAEAEFEGAKKPTEFKG